jgi:outer membrane protein assembly factor BamD
MARRQVTRVALAVLTALVAACATSSYKPPIGTPEPDKFLFERGTEALNKKKWFVAREYFKQLVDGFPQSQYRGDAKLGVGDTYLGEATAESYVLAQNEFREFIAYYPTHKRADYAQFKLAMTHFYQMHNAFRDQTETLAAITELQTLLQRFPNSPMKSEAEAKLRAARDRYGDYRYNIGFHYFRTMKWYPGAIERFAELLKDDPLYTNRDAVYFNLAEALVKIQRPAEALPYLDKLVAEFQKSEYLEQARKLSEQLKQELPKKVGS